MSVIARLRDFTADRDATPPIAISAQGIDDELDQLLVESNAQNTRLTTLEAPGNVGTGDLEADCVTPEKASFMDDAAVATDTHILIGDGNDFGNHPVTGDVTITNAGVTTISNDAITTSKILDAQITTEKLSPDCVVTAKVQNGSLLNEDFNANAAIDATKICDGSVSNDFFQRVPLGELKVSTNDTTNKTLSEKLVAGDDIVITQINDGGNETLEVKTKGELKISSNDTSVGTLSEKVVAGTGMVIQETNDGASETLHFSTSGQPIAWAVTQKTADFTVTGSDNHKIFETDTTSGNVVATLPAVSVVGSGFHIGFKKTVFANTLTLTPNSGDTIDEFNTAVLDDHNEYMQLISNGNNWLIIAEEFTEKFLGIKASDPSNDNEGGPLRDGDLYVSSVTEILRVYRTSSSSWVDTKATSLTNSWETFRVAGQSDVVADTNVDVVTFAGANEVAITTDASTDTITVGLPTYDAGLLHGTLPSGIGYKTVFFGLNVVNGVLQVTDSEGSSATFKPSDYLDSFLAGPDTSFTIDSLGHLHIVLT